MYPLSQYVSAGGLMSYGANLPTRFCRLIFCRRVGCEGVSDRTSLEPPASGLGHTVRLLPPSFVKAYLKRSKNNANDAAAICEAVTRPSMRFVATKSEEQQSGL